MCREDLVEALMGLELDGGRRLTRKQARIVVNEIFAAIQEALVLGDLINLPFCALKVFEHDRKPQPISFNGSERILYRRQNQIVFRGDEYLIDPET
jgi:nucleoid DNA-binding protein